MGDKLVAYYEFIRENGGMQEKMRLAMQTGVPSTKAAEAPDSPENIEKFKAAIKEITGKDAPA